MKYEDLTEEIIGCGYEVYNELGHGFLESVYENSLLVELNERSLNARNQVPIEVTYKSETVGNFVADLVVEESVVVELKVAQAIETSHEIQLVNYLVATDTEVGLLLNFGPEELNVKRKVKSLNEAD